MANETDFAQLAERFADLVAERVAARLAPIPMTTVAVDTWLTPREAAVLLKCSWKRLEALRREGGGPPFIKDGRLVRYARDDVLAYQTTKRKRKNTSESSAPTPKRKAPDREVPPPPSPRTKKGAV